MSLTFKFPSRALAAALIFAAYAGTAWSAAITPEMQQKIDAYKARAALLAADPVLIKSVKEANAKGAIASMDNTKWEPLP